MYRSQSSCNGRERLVGRIFGKGQGARTGKVKGKGEREGGEEMDVETSRGGRKEHGGTGRELRGLR